MSGTSASLTQSGASATASLKALSCTSINSSGAATLNGDVSCGVWGTGTTKFQVWGSDGALFSVNDTSISCMRDVTLWGTGNITQNNGTASLKAVSCTSLVSSGNIVVNGSVGANSINIASSPLYPTVRNSVITKPQNYLWYLDFASTATSVKVIFSDMVATTAGLMYFALGNSSGPLTTLYNGISSYETNTSNTLRTMTHGVPIMEVQATSAWGVIEFIKTDTTYWGVQHQHTYGTSATVHGGGVWKGTASPTRIYVLLATAYTGTLAYATTGSLSGTVYLQYS